MNKAWLKSLPNSFLANFYLGRLAWPLMSTFPKQSGEEKAKSAKLCKDVLAFLDEYIDGALIERDAELPADYLNAVRESGYLKLLQSSHLGGLELPAMTAYQIIAAASKRSIPATLVISMTNAFGIHNILPAVAEGPTKDLIRDRIKKGCISGWADTEVAGATNWISQTKATLSEDGQHYTLSGTKRYIGNGAVADCLLVSATVQTPDGKQDVNIFIVDTDQPGFSVVKTHDFMGLKGAPIAALAFDNVQVPVSHKIVFDEGHWRNTFLVEPLSALGRMLSVVSINDAICEQTLAWMVHYASNRHINGVPLSHYGAIKDILADSAAESFALKSVSEWCLVGIDTHQLPDRFWEMSAAKNIATTIASRLADRCVSVFGGEGFEKAPSKNALSYQSQPIEQAYRDVRGFRISGGVDFAIDLLAAKRWLATFFYQEGFAPDGPSNLPTEDSEVARPSFRDALELAQLYAAKTNAVILSLVKGRRYEDVTSEQNIIIAVNQIANEVFTMCAAIAKASATQGPERERYLDLAEHYCRKAKLRIEDLWRTLEGFLDNEYEHVRDRVMTAAISASKSTAER